MRYDYERDNLELNPVNKLNYEEGLILLLISGAYF
jgi:hypothetical protein